MSLDTLDDRANLIEGITEIIGGTGGIFLGTLMAMKLNGHVTEAIAITIPLGVPLIGDGISKIKKYNREPLVDSEISKFYSLPNYSVWDKIPDKTFSNY